MAKSQPDLVSIRQSRGLSLEQIAAVTKISLRYLRAIEEGRLAVLPGGVYTANYLRQYAEAIQTAGAQP
jgi:cytoskeletal protein RodZ